MNAEIVAIGTELVSGQRLDTNSQWLSRRLEERGIEVAHHAGVGDDLQRMVAVLSQAIQRVDLVLVSGGLGPTQDDLTREALALAAGVPLAENPDSLAAIEAFFARRNRLMPDRNRIQALAPEGAESLANSCGTAPGIWMKAGDAHVACLPGVPTELKRMFDEQVSPRLVSQGLCGTAVRVHRIVSMFGRGESDIEAEALDLTARGRQPEVGITASDATISFRLIGAGRSVAEANANLEPTLVLIRQRFGELIYSEVEGEELAQVVVRLLMRRGLTLATAESCTGGRIAHQMTALPGSSAVFRGGVVSYSNDSKSELLGVPPELIAAHGAVSEEVAHAMAQGVRTRLRADLAVSVTGIAGPDGGTAEKPVGLAYLGLATPQGCETRRLELGPDLPRPVIQSRACKHALNWVRLWLKQAEPSKGQIR